MFNLVTSVNFFRLVSCLKVKNWKFWKVIAFTLILSFEKVLMLAIPLIYEKNIKNSKVYSKMYGKSDFKGA